MKPKQKPEKRFDRKQYEKENRAKINKYKREWRKNDRLNNPEKVKEQDIRHRELRKDKQIIINKVQWAVESGKIKKPTNCECCQKPSNKLEGHHKDYSKPLDVIWLCPPCHGYTHRLCDDWEAYHKEVTSELLEACKKALGFIEELEYRRIANNWIGLYKQTFAIAKAKGL
jgi:hypothetical protein